MASYTFEAITAAQALAIAPGDTITMAGVPANQVSVLYNATGTITIIAGARSVEFSSAIAGMSQVGRLARTDGGRLFIGDDSPNMAGAPAGATLVDALYGGAGADTLEGGLGHDLLQGNAGADSLVGGSGSEVIYGGQDDDYIVSTIPFDPDVPFPTGDGGDFAQGNKGNDTIIGGNDADTLLGGQGNDQITGLSGANILNGNLGDDFVGGSGALFGEDGNDTLAGTGPKDTLSGGAGNDRIGLTGGLADGGAGNDVLNDGGGAERNATLLGGDGADTIDGQFASMMSASEHTYFGDAGNDSLQGTVWADTISGGEGNDTISGLGGPVGGVDRLSGGAGNDLFIIWNRTFGNEPATDAARIIDWEVNDRIDARIPDIGPATSATYHEITAASLSAAYAAAQGLRPSQGTSWVAAQFGNDVLVIGLTSNAYEATVVLTGRSLNDISFENFV